jgi:uncharacterized protein
MATRTVMWRHLQAPGSERCRLDEEGASLSGTAVTAAGGRPLELRYAITCDVGWRTRSVDLTMIHGAEERRLRLDVTPGARWLEGGDALPALHECIDVDIALGASTNTLPIRRLGLEVGASVAITAAWIRVPELSVEPLGQRYTRLAERRWLYESRDFRAELEVDELGLVTRYEGWCEAVASEDGAPAPAVPLRTRGLSHLQLAVVDLDRAKRFYADLFGVQGYYRDETSLQVLGPGSHDVISFELDAEKAGRSGGIGHFGFRLVDPADIDRAVVRAEAAGGKLLRRGEFAPGFPFAYVADPDGYEIEIWYE